MGEPFSGNKKGGLIVDYLGIAADLKQALSLVKFDIIGETPVEVLSMILKPRLSN